MDEIVTTIQVTTFQADYKRLPPFRSTFPSPRPNTHQLQLQSYSHNEVVGVYLACPCAAMLEMRKAAAARPPYLRDASAI